MKSVLMHTLRLILFAAMGIALARAETAHAQSDLPSRDLSGTRELFEQGRFEESLARYSAARESTDGRDAALIEQLDFNRAAVLLAMKRSEEAQKLFQDVDARTRSPALRSAARYNLGSMLSTQAEELGKTDPVKAVEALRTAERYFRNALIDNPSDADAARNIEIVQRKRDQLQKRQEQSKNEQKKEENKKDQKPQEKDDQKKDDSGDKSKPQDQGDKKPEDQQKPGDEQKPGDQQKPGSDQKNDPQKGSESQQDQNKQDADKQADGEQTGQSDQKEQKPDPAKSDQQGKSDEPAKSSDKVSEKEPNAEIASPETPRDSPREFDLAAAKILDKEKALRERLRKMFQANRSRAGKVEKDW